MPTGHEEGVEEIPVGVVGVVLGHEKSDLGILVRPFGSGAGKLGIDEGKEGKCILERVQLDGA
jgi:hypothetical protein